MVTVKVSETYDLKTTVGKVGVIGVHTPGVSQLQKLYPGLMKNHKYLRFRKCDVIGACASVLPADPLSVGVSEGTVAPEDMFNPILYKAVTNSSFDTLVSRIYDTVNTADVIDKTGSVNEQVLDLSDSESFKLYYGLLAENKKWRKSMPQRGFNIRGLVPICHTLISQYGNVTRPHTGTFEDVLDALKSVPDNLGNVPFVGTNLGSVGDVITANSMVFRGRPVKMPRMPLHYETELTSSITPDPKIPKTFVACLIIPPAKLHEFYYRMRVTWTISFEGVCSTMDYAGKGTFTSIGESSYGTDYTYEDSKSVMDTQSDSIDADNVHVNKIMEY